MLFSKTSLTFKRRSLINKIKVVKNLNNRKPACVVSASVSFITKVYNYSRVSHSFNSTLFFYKYFLAQLVATVSRKRSLC